MPSLFGEQANQQKCAEDVTDEIKCFETQLWHLETMETRNIAFFDVWEMESITHQCKIDKNICTDLLEWMVLENVIKHETTDPYCFANFYGIPVGSVLTHWCRPLKQRCSHWCLQKCREGCLGRDVTPAHLFLVPSSQMQFRLTHDNLAISWISFPISIRFCKSIRSDIVNILKICYQIVFYSCTSELQGVPSVTLSSQDT